MRKPIPTAIVAYPILHPGKFDTFLEPPAEASRGNTCFLEEKVENAVIHFLPESPFLIPPKRQRRLKRHTPLPELRKTGFFLGMAENLFDSCFSSPNLTGKQNVLEILEDSSDEMSYEQIVDKLREVEAPVHPACLAPSYDEAFMAKVSGLFIQIRSAN